MVRHHISRLHREVSFWVKVTIGIAGMIVLAGNIIASQTMPPLYFGLAADDRESAVRFLKSIRALPDYEKMLEAQKDVYGSDIEDEVNSPKLQQERIQHALESLHKKQPRDPQIAFALSQVSMALGEKQEATRYLKSAVALDPSIGVQE